MGEFSYELRVSNYLQNEKLFNHLVLYEVSSGGPPLSKLADDPVLTLNNTSALNFDAFRASPTAAGNILRLLYPRGYLPTAAARR